VTVLFEQPFLWPHLTLSQNILLPLQVKKMPMSGFDEIVELFQMTDLVDRYPNEVSAGRRQRAALVHGAILNPAYILLDEITAALDSEDRDNPALSTLSPDRAIARRLLARREGDELIFLEKGLVAASGGIELLTSPDHPRLREFLATPDYAS
jgi:L-cystine transport system ATP-binding protein